MRAFVVTPEMRKARARLEAYRDKVQPYPALPEEEVETATPITPTPRLYDKVGQLEGKLIYFQNKFNEHIDKSKKLEEHLYE